MYIYVHVCIQLYIQTHTYTYTKRNKWRYINVEMITLNHFLLLFALPCVFFFVFGCFSCFCFFVSFYIKLFEMGICLFLSQADSSEYALNQLPEHFHEVEEVGLSHWTAQAPSSFRLTDNGMKHLELLGKSIISCRKGNHFKQNKGQHKSLFFN